MDSRSLSSPDDVPGPPPKALQKAVAKLFAKHRKIRMLMRKQRDKARHLMAVKVNATPKAYRESGYEYTGKSFSAEMRNELDDFLCGVADTILKVRIVEFLLLHTGVCPSTQKLAMHLDVDMAEVRTAIIELSDAGVVLYSPQFGNADLCVMKAEEHSESMKHDLELLLHALAADRDAVFSRFDNAEHQS